MNKQSKIITIFFITALSVNLIIGSKALAQENQNSLDLIPEITAADLHVSSWATKGGIYKFLNDLQHTVRYLVTWNPLVQTKMNLTKANESLIVAKSELAKSQEDPETLKNFEKAMNRYNKEMAKINKRADKFKKKANSDPKLSKVLDKFIDNQLKQLAILSELINEAPTEQKTRIENVKESSLNNFAHVLSKLENQDKIADRLIEAMSKQKPHQYKELKDLEILDALAAKIPSHAKEAIKKTQTTTLIQLNYKLENLPKEKIREFDSVIKKIKVNNQIQSYVIDMVKRVELPEDLPENVATQETTEIITPENIPERKPILKKILTNSKDKKDNLKEDNNNPVTFPSKSTTDAEQEDVPKVETTQETGFSNEVESNNQNGSGIIEPQTTETMPQPPSIETLNEPPATSTEEESSSTASKTETKVEAKKTNSEINESPNKRK